jgi:hypothetical protein
MRHHFQVEKLMFLNRFLLLLFISFKNMQGKKVLLIVGDYVEDLEAYFAF